MSQGIHIQNVDGFATFADNREYYTFSHKHDGDDIHTGYEFDDIGYFNFAVMDPNYPLENGEWNHMTSYIDLNVAGSESKPLCFVYFPDWVAVDYITNRTPNDNWWIAIAHRNYALYNATSSTEFNVYVFTKYANTNTLDFGFEIRNSDNVRVYDSDAKILKIKDFIDIEAPTANPTCEDSTGQQWGDGDYDINTVTAPAPILSKPAGMFPSAATDFINCLYSVYDFAIEVFVYLT